MRIRDYLSDLFSCPKGWWHKWEWSSYRWTIGKINRSQAEGHSGWRCYNCGKMRYATNNPDGSFTFKTLEQCREERKPHDQNTV